MNQTTDSAGNAKITPCDDGSYCCGANAVAQSCCANHHGVFIKDGQETSVNPNATSSSTSSSTGPSASASTPSGSRKSENSGVNTGAIVGGVVGGVAVLAVIAGFGSYLLVRKRRRANAVVSTRDPKWRLDYDPDDMVEVDANNTQKIEIPGQAVMRPELRGVIPPLMRHELGEATPPLTEMDVVPR